MEHEKIERINELSRLSRERTLTPEEQTEREALRGEYLRAFRENARSVLESVRVQRPDGSLAPLQKKSPIKH